MPHIIPTRDLKSTGEISWLCHDTNEPIYITKNGYGDMVIMSLSLFDAWMFMHDVYARLAESDEAVTAGRSKNAKESLRRLREKHGVWLELSDPAEEDFRIIACIKDKLKAPIAALNFVDAIYERYGYLEKKNIFLRGMSWVRLNALGCRRAVINNYILQFKVYDTHGNDEKGLVIVHRFF